MSRDDENPEDGRCDACDSRVGNDFLNKMDTGDFCDRCAGFCSSCGHDRHVGACVVPVDKDHGGVAGEAPCGCEDDE